MQRRTRKTWGRLSFSAIVGLLAVGVACGQMPVQEAKAVQASRPNVLVFLTDDQRLAGTMAVLPHVLRWLEGGGRNFPLMFDTTPLCCPSRATLFTGLFAHNHGIVDNRHVGRDVFDQATTIQRYLDEAGYQTGLFGKLFNFWRVEDDPAYFDRWGIFHPTNRESGYLEATWNIQGELRDVRRYSTDFIAAQGVQFIRQAEAHDDDPWFLELSTYAPHLGAVVAPEYQDAPVGPFRATPAMLERDRSDKPPAVRREHTSPGKMRSARAGQLRLLMSVDDLVARIARALRRTGEMRDTLVIFLSDNGYLWGEHGIHAKGYPYTPDVQVPLFIRWPNHVSRGSTDRRLTAMVDIAPTILDAAGIEQDPDLPMDGDRCSTDRGAAPGC
jgi:arylsulfatase A-like enzyme